MFKSSFTVRYENHRVKMFILGVTSIVPNLNGILLFTEDGENHFIESCEMDYPNHSKGLYIEYSCDGQIDHYLHCAKVRPHINKVLDHRKK